MKTELSSSILSWLNSQSRILSPSSYSRQCLPFPQELSTTKAEVSYVLLSASSKGTWRFSLDFHLNICFLWGLGVLFNSYSLRAIVGDITGEVKSHMLSWWLSKAGTRDVLAVNYAKGTKEFNHSRHKLWCGKHSSVNMTRNTVFFLKITLLVERQTKRPLLD